jgi:hypothetical protein
MPAVTKLVLLLLIVLVAVGQTNAALRTFNFTIHSASRAPGMLSPESGDISHAIFNQDGIIKLTSSKMESIVKSISLMIKILDR